jgi:aquaglyceroporin related protein
VTTALAVFRGFPWRKVPIFILSQVLGALCGAAIVYANYFHAIDIYEGGRGVRTVVGATSTANLFSTYAVRILISCLHGASSLPLLLCSSTI